MDNEPIIENEPEDPNLDLSLVNPNAKAPDSVVLQATDTLAPEENLSVLSQLPQADVAFQPIKDKTDRIVHLKDVESQILNDDNIDISRADIVQESFGDLYGNHLNKNGFTKIPTKANFRETTRYMANQISLEEHALMDLFQAYLGDPCKQMLEISDKLQNVYYPGLLRIQESLVDELKTNREKILSNPNNALHLGGEEFINIVKTDLLTTDFAKLPVELKTTATFREAVEAIKSVFAEAPMFDFLRKVVDYSPDQKTISMVELVEFILEPQYMKLVGTWVEDARLSADAMQARVKEGVDLSDKPEKLTEFVVRNTPAFSEFNFNLTRAAAYVRYLTLLNLAIKQMLVTYYEL